MVDEDTGVNRFFLQDHHSRAHSYDEATELIEAKLSQAAAWAEEDGLELRIDPTLVTRVVSLSGGHPHLLQLLGSHLIEHEDDDRRWHNRCS